MLFVLLIQPAPSFEVTGLRGTIVKDYGELLGNERQAKDCQAGKDGRTALLIRRIRAR